MLRESTSELAVKSWELVWTIVLIVLLMLFRAFVFIKMWTWFIIPTFTTAPTLNYPTAIGLSLIAGFMQEHHSNEVPLKALYNAMVLIAVSWFLAWCVHLFM